MIRPFEEEVAAYVDRTEKHVLYRVTPIFDGENLLASGVLIEAYSVEDNGKGMFNRNNIAADILDGERLVISIAIGYGRDEGKAHKSKNPDHVTSGGSDRPYWFNYGVEMALLAPTAINQQKFEIIYDAGDVVFKDKGGMFSKIDLGIGKGVGKGI